MSTNYYLQHRPTDTQIDDLIKLVNSTKNGVNFKEVINLVHEMYDEPDEWVDAPDIFGRLHIGKRSRGWKFQWCPNIIRHNVSYMDNGLYVSKYEYELRYPLTKQGLTDFIMRDDIVVINEYNEVQDKKEFLEMAFSWYPDGYDSRSYDRESRLYNFSKDQEKYKSLGFEFQSAYDTDFINDGLRWTILGNFS